MATLNGGFRAIVLTTPAWASSATRAPAPVPHWQRERPAATHRGEGRSAPGRGEGGSFLRIRAACVTQGGAAWDIPGARLREQKLGKAQVHDRASLKAPPGLSQLDRIPELAPAHQTGREPVESPVKHADDRADERLFRHEETPRRRDIPRVVVKALRASSWRREACSLEEVCQTQTLHTSAPGASAACSPIPFLRPVPLR